MCEKEAVWQVITEGDKDKPSVWRSEYHLTQPMSWATPTEVLIQAELFSDKTPNTWIDRIFAVMALCPQHTFKILTKYPNRALHYFEHHFTRSKCGRHAGDITDRRDDSNKSGDLRVSNMTFPLSNVWIGVSISNQDEADERIATLLKIPAAIRWANIEPLLGKVCLSRFVARNSYYMTRCEHCGWIGSSELCFGFEDDVKCASCERSICGFDAHGLDWVVVSGGVGPSAKPMLPDWVREIRDCCAAAQVPFSFTQWGEWGQVDTKHLSGARGTQYAEWCAANEHWCFTEHPNGINITMAKVGSQNAGRELDGLVHNDKPDAVRKIACDQKEPEHAN